MVEMKKKELPSYKVRKSGNSDITTIPADVKKALNIETGDSVKFVLKSDGKVELVKAEAKVDIDKLIENSMAQYNELLDKLVDV